jgi:hypothetical protein
VRENNGRVHRVPLIVQGLQVRRLVGCEAVHPLSPRMSHWGYQAFQVNNNVMLCDVRDIIARLSREKMLGEVYMGSELQLQKSPRSIQGG